MANNVYKTRDLAGTFTILNGIRLFYQIEQLASILRYLDRPEGATTSEIAKHIRVYEHSDSERI